MLMNIQQGNKAFVAVVVVVVAAISLVIVNNIPPSFAQAANTTSNEKSSLDYISNIRSLLDQVISSYSANDATKAKELATTAYLDNFEHIEQPIGKELSDQGESLLREKLRAQIGNNASVEEIKQTISEISMLLDKAENLLKS
jgi:predicted lipid-binding transport protein (Tim44 family)